MTESNNVTVPDLWSFANEFYQLPGYADRLLTWQMEGDLDICLLLFALWLTAKRQLVDPAWQKSALISHCHIYYLQPLRQLRGQMKHLSGQYDCFSEFYQKMKEMELSLEQVYLNELEQLAANRESVDQVTLAGNIKQLGIMVSTAQVHWLETGLQVWMEDKRMGQ